jgi:O-antigen/teichoic acid export membrane protein
LFKNIFIYVIAQGLASLISFALLPFYTKHLTPVEFGIATLIQVNLTFISMLLTFGLNTGFMIRYFKENNENIKKMFTIVLLIFFASIFILILILPFKDFYQAILGFKATLLQLLIFFATILFYNYVSFYLGFLKNQLKAFEFSIYSVCYALVNGAATIYFIVQLKYSYLSFLYGAFIANGIFALIGTVYYRNYFCKINYSSNKKIIKDLFRISWPILPSQISSSVINLNDKYQINSLLDQSFVGIYSVGARFGGMFQNFLISPFISSYNPIAFELFSKDTLKFKEVQKKYFLILPIISIMLILGLGIVFKPLFEKFIDRRYWSGYYLIFIFMVGFIFQGITSIVGITIIMSEKLHISMVVGIFAAIINLLLNYFFIKSFGILGAALAMLVSSLIVFILTYTINNRLLKINYPKIKLLFIIIVGLIAISLQNIIVIQNSYYSFIIKFGIAVLSMIVLYFTNRELLNINQFATRFNLFFKKWK